ncbi:hypothetical protein ACP70R_040765 [Stipagrostis hirtigluma subsp. patula]
MTRPSGGEAPALIGALRGRPKPDAHTRSPSRNPSPRSPAAARSSARATATTSTTRWLSTRASSLVPGDTSSGDSKDVDSSCDVQVVGDDGGTTAPKLDLKWMLKPECIWQEKVLDVLQIVRCQEFTEYDPKNDDFVPTRFCRFNIAFFDFEKESTVEVGPPLSELGPSDWMLLEASVNVISLTIAESDEGYPIRVFGTVIARDQLDYKCVYLFRRDRDNPQIINSANDMLTLTGPYRVLAVTDSMFFEISLRTIDDTGDRVLSKGVIEHNAIRHTETMSWLVTSWLSTVELVYAPVEFAVEATLAIKILKGPCTFIGKVIAWTSGNHENHIILYDSEADGTETVITDDGSVRLSRSAVAVKLGQKLVANISACDADEGCKLTLGQYDDKHVFRIGSYELEVKVTWTSKLEERRQDVFENFGCGRVLL